MSKAEARIYTQRMSHYLRHNYSIGASGPGKDVVVVISSGQVLLAPLFYGVIGAGGIYSAASSSFTHLELARQVTQGHAKLIIASPDCVDVALRAAQETGLDKANVLVLESMGGKHVRSLRRVDGHGQDAVAGQGSQSQRLPWEVVTDPEILSNRVICLLYSSGTTGVPKGES